MLELLASQILKNVVRDELGWPRWDWYDQEDKHCATPGIIQEGTADSKNSKHPSQNQSTHAGYRTSYVALVATCAGSTLCSCLLLQHATAPLHRTFMCHLSDRLSLQSNVLRQRTRNDHECWVLCRMECGSVFNTSLLQERY